MKRPLSAEEINRIEELAKAASHYELLSLSPGASRETVDSAYRAYVREWHPDRFFSRDCDAQKPVIEQNFVNVTRAYETLRDERRRRDYDHELLASGKMPGFRPSPAASPSFPSRAVTPPRPAPPSYSPQSVVPPRPAPAATPPRPPPPKPPPEPEPPGYEVTFGRAEPPKNGRVETPKMEAPRPPPPSPANLAVQRLRAQLAEQNAKALAYLTAAKADFEAGQFISAEGSLYLAMKLAPQNTEIQEFHQKASEKAKVQRVTMLLHQAEQAEQNGRPKEALLHYQKACELDPPDGKAWFQIAKLKKAAGEDDSPKEQLILYKKAVLKSPKVLEYRLAAAGGYYALGMTANAHREALAALELDPKNETAKEMVKKTRQ